MNEIQTMWLIIIILLSMGIGAAIGVAIAVMVFIGICEDAKNTKIEKEEQK